MGFLSKEFLARSNFTEVSFASTPLRVSYQNSIDSVTLPLAMVAAVFAYMSPGGSVRKLLLFSAAIPIAITANIVRLLVTCLGALLISPGFAEGFLHDFSGVVVFLVGLTMFFITGSLLKWLGKKLATGLSSA